MATASAEGLVESNPIPPRPTPSPIFPEHIPAELRCTDQWVCWTVRLVTEKKTGAKTWKKSPCDTTGTVADAINPANHLTFEAAVAAVGQHGVMGIGFSVTERDNFVGVDLDDCFDDYGDLQDWASDVVGTFSSYTEVSPSGQGIHIWIFGQKPEGGCRKGKVEIYGQKRFFCVTGNHLPDTPLELVEAQAALDAVHAKYLADNKPKIRAEIQAVPKSAADHFSDDEVLYRMFSAQNADKAKRLFEGDSSDCGGDVSSADSALCCILAFWTRKDPDQMDRIFRASGRNRDKWDEKARAGETYGQGTIKRAIAITRDVYQRGHPSKVEEPDNPNAKRPQILISTDEHDTIDATVLALKRDKSIYTRGRQLVSVGYQNGSDEKIDRAGGLAIVTVPAPNLRERITRSCKIQQWVSEKGDVSLKNAHCPPWLVQAVHARGEWPGIPFLKGVVNHPVMMAGGRILFESGYDVQTGVLVQTDLKISISENPTSEECYVALNDLLEIIGDFNFPEPKEAHMAAWLSAVLTLFARPAIDGPCPLFLADKSVRGAGGSKITDCIAEIALGRSLPRMSQVDNDDELRKRITSVLLSGDEAVLIDNVESLGGAPLDALLTGTTWRDRILSKSEMSPEIPATTVWFATGNNVFVKGDTVRRVLPFRIEPVCENPETRTGFKFPDLLATVRERRSLLASAALTILRGYMVAGSPDFGLETWGSYEAFSALIRNAVVWTGLPDPKTTRGDLATVADRDRVQLEMFFEAIHSCPTLVNTFTTHKVAKASETWPPLREALEEMSCLDGEKIKTQLLGHEIRKAKGRQVSGFKIDLDRASTKGNVWRLIKVEGERT